MSNDIFKLHISVFLWNTYVHYTQLQYSRDSGMKQEYAKLILSLQLLGEIERVKMSVQILKNVNKD